ncbi:hypothetical protein PO124_20120 [Bacillus licheniformis]|nr:hypothetical protein [Bacillus licheniformis]
MLADEESARGAAGSFTMIYFTGRCSPLPWPLMLRGFTKTGSLPKSMAAVAGRKQSHTPLPIAPKQVHAWNTITEIPWVTTNCVSQWCLNTIAVLELLKDMPPDQDMQERSSKQ